MDETKRRALLDRYRDGIDAVRGALAGATDDDLDRRPGVVAWTAREVAHHLCDSEATSTIRLRRLLAEDQPVIHAYDEVEFAERLHYDRPIEHSLAVFEAVRLANLELLEHLTEAEWSRAGTHSEDGHYSVEGWLQIYADHGHDHADQIRRAREGRL